tara:strand:+ start:2641 stop:3171 length:531 start_codon:yes stop_codon:yes gene_type:complete
MDELLEYFISEPERELHVRELAKLAKKSPTTVSKRLSKLEKDGLLQSRSKLNHLLFKANSDSLNFKDVKICYNIKKLRHSGLIEFLVQEFNHPEAIVLFGSFGKGENTLKSDIDLLIITSSKQEINLAKFEKIVGYKIQLFVYSTVEMEKMKIKNKELLNNLINGIKLHGFWELFK